MAIILCPQCKAQTEFSPANAWRPFCSERCKMIDLGAWASGQYSVPIIEQDLLDDAISSELSLPENTRLR